MHTREPLPIALIGLMGAGKSAVARLLGERLGAIVADLDAMLEAEQGADVAGLFARSGEAWFRQREAELLERVLGSNAGVIACGGGIVLDPAPRDALERRCRVVWLEVSPSEAARRIADAGPTRPLLAGHDPALRLAALLAERSALYGATAQHRVATDGRSPDEVADTVLARFDRGAP